MATENQKEGVPREAASESIDAGHTEEAPTGDKTAVENSAGPTASRPEAEPPPAVDDSRDDSGAKLEPSKPNLRALLIKLLPKIIVLVAVGFLIVTVIFLYSRTKAQAVRIAEETRKREAVELQVTDLEQNLTQKLDRLNALQDELKSAQGKRDLFETEVNSLKANQVQLQEQLENGRSYQKTIEERLAAEQQTVAALQKKIDEDWEKQKMLFSKVESLMEEKMTLQEKLLQLKSESPEGTEVTMPKLVVTEHRSTSSTFQGAVLAVDRRYDFVVFNLGEKDGIKTGDRFYVLDQGKKVGEVVARRVLPAMTVADIDLEKTNRRLKKNFAVALHE